MLHANRIAGNAALTTDLVPLICYAHCALLSICVAVLEGLNENSQASTDATRAACDRRYFDANMRCALQAKGASAAKRGRASTAETLKQVPIVSPCYRFSPKACCIHRCCLV